MAGVVMADENTNAEPKNVSEGSGVTVKPEKYMIGIGDSYLIKATLPAGEEAEVVWSSGDESIASVEGDGEYCTVTGVAEGKTKIRATVGENYAESMVYVYTVEYAWYGDFDTGEDVECIAFASCDTSFGFDDGEIEKNITKKPSCTENGSCTYTATFINTLFDDQTKTEDLAALGHDFENPVVTPATTGTDGIISETCSRCGQTTTETIDHIQNVTLSGTKFTYTGKVITPTVAVTDCKGNTIPNSNYTVAYQKGRKDVGKYAVTVTFKNNYQGTVTKYFTIVKNKPTVTLKKKATIYNGKIQKIGKATVTGSKGKVTYYYYQDKACKRKTTPAASGSRTKGGAPRNAGIYYVKAKVAATKNSKAAISKATILAIKKAETTIELTDLKTVYTGQIITIPPAVVSGSTGEVKYKYYTDKAMKTLTTNNNSGANFTGGAPCFAGTYYVLAAVKGDGDHRAASDTAVLTILKANSSILVENKTDTYTSKPIAIKDPVVKGSAGKVTVTYYTDETCKKKTSKEDGATAVGGAPANVGVYYAIAVVAADRNCKAAKSSIARLEIKKANVKITFKGETVKYTGSPIAIHPATFDGNPKGEVTYQYYVRSSCSGTDLTTFDNSGASVDGGPPADRGTYYVKVTVAGDSNYKQTTSPAVKFVIK